MFTSDETEPTLCHQVVCVNGKRSLNGVWQHWHQWLNDQYGLRKLRDR
jgi:hypothetical protein